VSRSSAGLGSGVSLSCPADAFCPAAMSRGRTGRTCRSSPSLASLWPETWYEKLSLFSKLYILDNVFSVNLLVKRDEISVNCLNHF